MSIALTSEQVASLVALIDQYHDGGELALTGQGDGTVVVAFEQATFSVDTDGVWEEI